MLLSWCELAVKGNHATKEQDTIKADTSQGIEQLKGEVQDWKIWKDLAHRIVKN